MNNLRSDLKIGIIDYNVGNISSIQNGFKRVGARTVVSNDPTVLEACTHLVLPGVGAFDEASNNLFSLGIQPHLEKWVFTDKKPILGICVGMQLMMDSSTENGVHKGLGWISGTVEKIPENDGVIIPHVGWNDVEGSNFPLFDKLDPNPDFYFDHSYYCNVEFECVKASVNYPDALCAAFASENIYAVQFHPEKSQINGLRVFKNFMEISNA